MFDDKSYPCEFPAEISFPNETTLDGLNPSKTTLNGTINLRELIEVNESFNEIEPELAKADDG